jgi:hypothetical protein
MATERQTLANRRNAAKSSGPRTPEGKAVACRNSLKHGLTADVLLLPGEERQAYEIHADEIANALQPVGAFEQRLAARIVNLLWRLNRAERVETGLFAQPRWLKEYQEGRSPTECLTLAFMREAGYGDTFSRLSRYEARLERAFYRTLHELQRLQADRQGHAVPAPAVLDITLDAPGED